MVHHIVHSLQTVCTLCAHSVPRSGTYFRPRPAYFFLAKKRFFNEITFFSREIGFWMSFDDFDSKLWKPEWPNWHQNLSWMALWFNRSEFSIKQLEWLYNISSELETERLLLQLQPHAIIYLQSSDEMNLHFIVCLHQFSCRVKLSLLSSAAAAVPLLPLDLGKCCWSWSQF
jgi:hypothetical protein